MKTNKLSIQKRVIADFSTNANEAVTMITIRNEAVTMITIRNEAVTMITI
jgi:hypothetical protein